MICSAHFTENCFEQQLIISRDLGMSFRPVLKKDVVPTILSRGKRTHDKLAGASPQPTACSSSQELKCPGTAFKKRLQEYVFFIDRSKHLVSSFYVQVIYYYCFIFAPRQIISDFEQSENNEENTVSTQTRFINVSRGKS